MKREDIIRMARESGLDLYPGWIINDERGFNNLIRFAALVSAAEREKFISTTDCPPDNYPQTLLVQFDGYYRPGSEVADYHGDGVWSTQDIPSHWRELPDAVGDGSVKEYGCHCDLEPDMKPDGCVFDEGMPQDCVYARILMRKNEGKTECEYWKPIEREGGE